MPEHLERAREVLRVAAGDDLQLYGDGCWAVDILTAAGFVIVADDPEHYVTFDEDGWFIEHSMACRIAGTLGTCKFNQALHQRAQPSRPDRARFGRWRMEVDDEGEIGLERVDG